MNDPGPIREPIVIGRIVAHHGLKGWARIQSYTRPREQISEYETVLIGRGGTWQRLEIEGYRQQSRHVLMRIDGCRTREDAEEFIGSDIGIEYGQLSELPEGEYYWIDLIGLNVVGTNGSELGTVSGVMETGANDVLVVRKRSSRGKEREVLIPWISGVVTDVSVGDGLIVADWQEDFL
ncbi:MAG: ribosome maturation factor RimM [Gammaproteobacteria bacterium]|nr:ribosome maturation factor RimM [Gammaproteobacteria bacterium]MYD75243.1 ribosome maturation factor RimM [Gammaproteobacteria bacterium]